MASAGRAGNLFVKVSQGALLRAVWRPHLMSVFITFLAGTLLAQEVPPSWPAVDALFQKHCVMCHAGEHAAAGLHLDSYEGTLAGSKNGPVIIPGNASASELIRRVRGESLPRMPFLSYPLGADEIALLEDWIATSRPEEGAQPK